MKKGAVFSILIWLLIVSASLYWNIFQSNKQFHELALHSARSFFQQITLTREWASKHGGIYVPVTKETQPNLYLDKHLREVRINKELLLTKINPAYLLRQLSELAAQKEAIQFHITSLKPLRPENKATKWETGALEEFSHGVAEKSMFVTASGQSTFIYMAPLFTQKSCLTCHKDSKVGDLRGGIRISLPLAETQSKQHLYIYIGHLALALAGVVGILIFWHMLTTAYRKIQEQTREDALTGIANRRYFSLKIQQEFERSRRNQEPLSVLMCDIDNFKEYNDNYGHMSGDEVLRKVAWTIQQSVHRPSDFCARYGGEEFVVILPNTTEKGALKVANTILNNIAELNIVHNHSPFRIITMSIGTATDITKYLLSYEELLKEADKALYSAKHKGKNRVEQTPENNESHI